MNAFLLLTIRTDVYEDVSFSHRGLKCRQDVVIVSGFPVMIPNMCDPHLVISFNVIASLQIAFVA